MTSSENTKRALIEVLKGKTSSVIALSGRWGTGKTYLWKEVEKTLLASHAETADPVYISLFGVKTIAELKLRIIQAAAIKGGPLFQTFQKGTGSILKGIAGKFLPGSALDDVILLSVPTLIKGRLVVIDDVERKHKTLDIDEVLGFLNEYAENYSTRFILLLNTDKLADQSTWETLHEKVIDIEIVLDPTVAEAFDVAIKGVAFEYIEKIRDALNILGITNIRIIRRVIRVVVRLLGKTATLDDSLLGRTIPSTVLLTCIHYRAAIAGLTTEYVTTHNSFSKAFAQNERSSEEIEWDELLQKLNIRGTDEYEDLVIRYLQKGLLDDAKVTAVLNTYRKSATENAVQSRLDAFTRDFFWDSTLDPQLALENARSFLNDISILNVVAISNLSDMVSEIGDRELSVLLIDRWIDNFRATPQLEVTENSFEYQHQKISPVILEALRKLKEEKFPRLSLLETMQRIRVNSGWGDRERSALSKATVNDYELCLRELRTDELGMFLHENFSLLRTQGLDAEFIGAVDRFIDACRRICTSDPLSRLAAILKREFHRNQLSARITTPAPTFPPPPKSSPHPP